MKLSKYVDLNAITSVGGGEVLRVLFNNCVTVIKRKRFDLEIASPEEVHDIQAEIRLLKELAELFHGQKVEWENI